MREDSGYMPKRWAVLAILLLGAVARTQAGDYSNIYLFGDSLSDSGAYRPLVGPNARFTTNPGTVWGENLGARYGTSITPAYAASKKLDGFSERPDGNNFAVGSALVNAQPTGVGPLAPLAPFIPSVHTQVSSFLARGAVDANALYALWAGGNDVFAQFVGGAGAASPAAQAAIVTAANDLSAQMTRLQSAGARHFVVFNLANSYWFPYGQTKTAPEKAQIEQLNNAFDATLGAQMAGRNVLYFDTNKLFAAIFATPLAYGFTDTTNPACGAIAALLCSTPAAGHLFADDKHPSTLFHKLLSDWVYGSLEGAARIGLLSLVPLGRSGAQWRSIDGRMNEFQNFGYRGQGFFVTGDYSASQKEAAGGQPAADGAGSSLIMGYEKAFSDRLFGGLTLGYGKTPFALGNDQGTVKYEEWALSAFASHKFGSFYANALATYAWLNYQSTRNVGLGNLTTGQQGATRGRQFGAKGQLGYHFGLGHLVHGPLLGLAWERVDVDGFSESPDSLAAMTFSSQSRASLRSRLGWQIATESRWAGVNVRPYAQLTYDYEHLKDERSYSAGLLGSNSAMTVATANRTGGYGNLLAGISSELSTGMRLAVTASTTINQPGADNSALNFTLSAPF
ncbi:MAG: EstA protein [Proteobacteria bacterium]|nr:EstA protein [Pseudomonadota bacterium]